MKTATTYLTLILLVLGQLVGATSAAASGTTDATSAITNALSQASDLREEMGTDAWSAIQGNLSRLQTLNSNIFSLGNTIESERSTLESAISHLGWLRLEAESAIKHHDRVLEAINREAEHLGTRESALDREIKWHNANKPDPTNHPAVNAYNSQGAALRTRAQRLKNERAALISKHARTVLPLQLIASKKKRIWHTERAKIMRDAQAFEQKIKTFNGYVGEANTIIGAVRETVNAGIIATRNTAVSQATQTAQARQALVNKLAELNRGLAQTVAQRKKTEAEQDGYLRQKKEAVRGALKEAYGLVSVDKMMKRLRNVQGVGRALLTPKNAERVRAAMEAVKTTFDLSMATQEKTDQAQRVAILGTLTNGREALARAQANLGSLGDRRELRQLQAAHKLASAAAKIWKARADHGSNSTSSSGADVQAAAELVADIGGMFNAPLRIGRTVINIGGNAYSWNDARKALQQLEENRAKFLRAEHRIKTLIRSAETALANF